MKRWIRRLWRTLWPNSRTIWPNSRTIGVFDGGGREMYFACRRDTDGKFYRNENPPALAVGSVN
jgi:hypothetical protein